MRKSILLITGITSISIGILFRTIDLLEHSSLFFILFGVLCKIIYIIIKVRTGIYKPGKELIVLAIGLLLFFLGLHYTKTKDLFINPDYLILLGVTLKTVFIIKFIKIIRSGNMEQ